LKDREDCEQILKGTGAGGQVKRKQLKEGYIHTLPILLICQSRSKKERLEGSVEKAIIIASSSGPRKARTL
jgi:hypothetical protein